MALAVFYVWIFAILSTTRAVFGDDKPSEETLSAEPVQLAAEMETRWQPTHASGPNPAPCKSAVPISEIYEISTRHLPDRFTSINFCQTNVEVNKWSGNGWFRTSVEDALPSGGSGVLTIVYVHGNFMERQNARERVRIVDSYFRKQADRPYRLLMLSWPSQPEKRPIRDALTNADSADCHSLYIAWMLQHLRDEPQVSLLGFSFGARAVTGGLHLDAGGVIPGYATSPIPNQSPMLNYRLGLVAPAIDRHWMENNGRHRMALTHVDSLVNLYNSRDPILRRFRFVDRFSRPTAAGFAGFAGIATLSDPRSTTPLSGQTRIRQYDCGAVIGTTHSEKSYYGECPYFCTLVQHLLWKEPRISTSNAPVIP